MAGQEKSTLPVAKNATKTQQMSNDLSVKISPFPGLSETQLNIKIAPNINNSPSNTYLRFFCAYNNTRLLTILLPSRSALDNTTTDQMWLSCGCVAWLVTLAYIAMVTNTVYQLFEPDIRTEIAPPISELHTPMFTPEQQFDVFVYLSGSPNKLGQKGVSWNAKNIVFYERVTTGSDMARNVSISLEDMKRLCVEGVIVAHVYANPVSKPSEPIKIAQPANSNLYFAQPMTKKLKLPLNETQNLFYSNATDKTLSTVEHLARLNEMHWHWASKL
jgi:hypothetical protein